MAQPIPENGVALASVKKDIESSASHRKRCHGNGIRSVVNIGMKGLASTGSKDGRGNAHAAVLLQGRSLEPIESSITFVGFRDR